MLLKLNGYGGTGYIVVNLCSLWELACVDGSNGREFSTPGYTIACWWIVIFEWQGNDRLPVTTRD